MHVKSIIKKIDKISVQNLQDYFDTEKLSVLHKVKLYLDDKYYNDGISPLSDVRYDMLKDTLIRRDKNFVPTIGAKLRTGENRVALPYWLGSADKITPEEPDMLARWVKDNSAKKYIISDKLDGVSCLLQVKNGEIKLYTRGNGIIGADISYLSPYFTTIPKNLENITVRGELIISNKAFQPYKRKSDQRSLLASGSKDYKNARNMVAGLIGAKTARHGLKAIDFVAYEIVGDSMPKPSKSFKKLAKLGFTVVTYTITENISIQNLSKLYLKSIENSIYDIDGLIVQPNVPYDRNTSGNPDYIFAFKMLVGDSIHKTTVKSIEWNISKWGHLKPVAIIEPVKLSEITIKRATAHNAKYVEENNLGPGSIIRVTRSKEVIPYIVEVVKGSKKPQLPDREYVWDKNHVNIIVKTCEDIMCIKLISSFFSKLGIKHVSEATVRKMFENGLDNLLKIVGASKKRLLSVPQFQKKSADRIYTNIHNGLKNVKLSTVIGASGVLGFGIGRKRMDMLFLDIPNLLTIYKKKTRAEMLDIITNVEGFSDIMAVKVVDNLKYADKLVKKLGKYATFKTETRVSDSMKGQKYVMTGFRDKKLEDDIGERGGKVTSSVSKNTTGLIVISKGGKLTGKSKKANDLGIPIYEKSEFISKFIK